MAARAQAHRSLPDHEAIALFLAELAKTSDSTRTRIDAPIGARWMGHDDVTHVASLVAWLTAVIEADEAEEEQGDRR
jgi:hypothetical protein